MRNAIFLLPVLLAVTVAAGCGGGGSASLKASDVATVGSTHIPKTQFDALMAQAKQSFAQQKQAFPKQGTTAYETVKGQAVTLLVQQAEREAKAASMGIKITDKNIADRLTQIKKQYFGGSEQKYLAELKARGLTDAEVRDDVRSQLISEAVYNKVTKSAAVSSADIHAYYLAHAQDYSQPQQRDVRYVLVKKKALANTLYGQLKSGNDKTWCAVAKKYSQDPSSKNSCGKATFSKGQTVAEFDKVLFSAATKSVQAPIYNKQYGWFVIEPLSNIKPSSTTPESQVAATIKQTLLTQKKNQVMTDWVTSLTKTYCSGGKVSYQAGYQPTPDPCASVTTTSATTTG